MLPTSDVLAAARRRPSQVCRTAAILISLAVVPVRWANAQAASDVVEPAELRVRLDSLFEPWRGTDRPGCAVGVSHRGRVVLERAYGMADLESGTPMTPATVVHAASLAKSVTALAVLLLARDGKLALDDDVRRYLPELPDYRARHGGPVTVRHLLSHTGGLRDFFELLILARGRFEEDRITDADALAVIGRQSALNFAPGTQYGYSNTATCSPHTSSSASRANPSAPSRRNASSPRSA